LGVDIGQTVKILRLIFVAGFLMGCQFKTETYVSTTRHKNGSIASHVTYEKLNRDGLDNLLELDPKHGLVVFYKDDGTVEHSGEWKHGVPWNGECYILEVGDAGSWGGLGRWIKFKEGKSIE
jgi:hypothetical protein